MLHLEAMPYMGSEVTLMLCLEQECLLAGNGAWSGQRADIICGSEYIPEHHSKHVLASNWFFFFHDEIESVVKDFISSNNFITLFI